MYLKLSYNKIKDILITIELFLQALLVKSFGVQEGEEQISGQRGRKKSGDRLKPPSKNIQGLDKTSSSQHGRKISPSPDEKGPNNQKTGTIIDIYKR